MIPSKATSGQRIFVASGYEMPIEDGYRLLLMLPAAQKRGLKGVVTRQTAQKQNLSLKNLSGPAVPRRPRLSTAASMIGGRPGG